MNIFELIELKKPLFTRTDMQVYDRIFENNEIVFRKSSAQLAKDLNLSQASIIRFCKKLGFEGYNDFRFSLYDAIHSSDENTGFSSKGECYKKLIDLISAAAEKGDFDRFAEDIAGSGMVYCTGMHRSSLPAQLMCIELGLLGKRAVFLRDDMIAAWPKDISNKDVFVCFSEQGDPSRRGYDSLLQIPEENRPETYLICMNAKHPMRKQFSHQILLPGSTNQNLPERVEPSAVFIVFVDFVTNIVVNKMREERDDENQRSD